VRNVVSVATFVVSTSIQTRLGEAVDLYRGEDFRLSFSVAVELLRLLLSNFHAHNAAKIALILLHLPLY